MTTTEPPSTIESLTARIEALSQERVSCAIDGRPWPPAQARALSVALENREVLAGVIEEQGRRAARDANAKAATKRDRTIAEIKQLEANRLEMVARAEAMTKALVIEINDIQLAAGLLATMTRSLTGCAPLTLTANAVDDRLSRRVATAFQAIRSAGPNDWGGLSWPGIVAPPPSWQAGEIAVGRELAEMTTQAPINTAPARADVPRITEESRNVPTS